MEPLSELILRTLIETTVIKYDRKKEILTSLKLSADPIITVDIRKRIIEFLNELDLNNLNNKQ